MMLSVFFSPCACSVRIRRHTDLFTGILAQVTPPIGDRKRHPISIPSPSNTEYPPGITLYIQLTSDHCLPTLTSTDSRACGIYILTLYLRYLSGYRVLKPVTVGLKSRACPLLLVQSDRSGLCEVTRSQNSIPHLLLSVAPPAFYFLHPRQCQAASQLAAFASLAVSSFS
jgi:hypothetical protein